MVLVYHIKFSIQVNYDKNFKKPKNVIKQALGKFQGILFLLLI